MGFALRPAVSSEAHLLRIIGAEFITIELPVWGAPRLQLSVYNRQTLPAKFTACRRVCVLNRFVHLVPAPLLSSLAESLANDRYKNDTYSTKCAWIA